MGVGDVFMGVSPKLPRPSPAHKGHLVAWAVLAHISIAPLVNGL